MNSIGFYITMALVGAAAAYGVINKGKPRPRVSSGRKKLLIVCATVIVACLLLLLVVVLISQSSPHY